MNLQSGLYNLRTLYELRKTKALKTRLTVARVFEHKGSLGLVDASGCLWPVAFPVERPPTPGTSVYCETETSRQQGYHASKYEDNGYLIAVKNILDLTPCLKPWPNATLPSPISEMHLTLKDADGGHTQFFSSPASRREKKLEFRRVGLEKTSFFFECRGFKPMETPTLVPSGGVEAYVSSFHTNYTDVRGKQWPLTLPTSPEFALKKLLAEGHQKIYQLSRAYRNAGELARWHEPEFMMLEWYRSGATLQDMMNDTRDLVLFLERSLSFQASLPQQWPTHSVRDLFLRHCKLDLSELQDEQAFRSTAQTLSSSITATDDWDSVFCKLFMEKIEPHLANEKACFVTGYPRRMGALARVAADDLYVERFEAYLHGVEICNGYFELTDTQELNQRFDGIARNRQADEVKRDSIFEDTMGFGLPPCAGNALGIDRTIAILTGLPSIAPLMPIPFLSQFPKNTVAPE
jgi:lysyl-tRNA synthetase class 2